MIFVRRVVSSHLRIQLSNLKAIFAIEDALSFVDHFRPLIALSEERPRLELDFDMLVENILHVSQFLELPLSREKLVSIVIP